MNALILALGVILGFVLGRVPSGDLPHPRTWRYRITCWNNNRRCRRGDHADLSDDGAWCAWCEQTTAKGKAMFAPGALS